MPYGVPLVRSRAGHTRTLRHIAVAMSVALMVAGASACTTDSAPDGSPTGGATPPAPNSPIRVNARPAGASLLPSDLADETTRRVASLIYRGLVTTDPKGKPIPTLASSLASADGVVWTIDLVPEAQFSDSSPITATTFAKSWAFTAARTAEAGTSTPLARIEGYPGDGSVLRGVEVVDSNTLRVTLSAPAPGFDTELADASTAPLPPASLADPAAAATRPVGNGPYVLATPWTGDGEFTLRPNGVYAGTDKPVNAGLTFRTYATLDEAYRDLTEGHLDVLDELPPDKSDEVGKAGYTVGRQPVGLAVSLDFPADAADWTGGSGLGRRFALATAVDRARAAQRDYAGARSPATDLAAPVVDGYSPDLCGEVCQTDVKAATEAWRTAGPLTRVSIAYAADGTDAVAVNAICTDITEVLGTECSGAPYANEIALRTAVRDGTVTGPYLRTWKMRQRSLGGFLVPRFSPGAFENWGGYVDPLPQAQLQVASAASTANAQAAYSAAQRLILRSLPAIPLWSVNATTTSVKTVTNVLTDAEGVPVYGQITRPAG